MDLQELHDKIRFEKHPLNHLQQQVMLEHITEKDGSK